MFPPVESLCTESEKQTAAVHSKRLTVPAFAPAYKPVFRNLTASKWSEK
jgi:hypothetical protein